ncbi:hypothetical protein BDZ45DRAFT_750541 [Acephala macrosclerotiorum]|nr:hypothetical protein BDZ45DRAFT_750541 [Acephala macrosclerotiorum]
MTPLPSSILSDSSATLPTAHLISTPSPTVSLPSTDSLTNLLQSDQASTTGTLPPGSRVTLGPSGTAGGGGGGGGGGGPSSNSSDIPTNTGLDIYPISQVVVGNYVPIILGRAFIQFLTPFYQTMLLHEPIRQLTNPGGAPFSALAGSPAIAFPINAALLVANIGSGFTAGATFLDTSYCTTVPCPPKLSSNPWVINVIITTLIIQAVAILFMMSQWWKKPNSLSADPTSIAGVAVVMGHPTIESEFSNVPADLTTAELSRRLKGRKYKLGNFQTGSGIVKFGIMPVPPSEIAAKKAEKGPGFFSKLGGLKEKIPFINDWRNNRFYFDAVFTMLLLALLGLTCAALSKVDQTKVVFLATAAASGTGMRIFFAVLGTIVAGYWGRLFRDMQTFTPYIDLGRGDAEPDPTILLKRHTFPITAFLPLLWNGHFTAASVAFTGLAAEFLIIALAGLPYRPGQQRGEFLFWSVLSLAILTLMVIQLLIVNVWRRKLPMLTRPPDTIASVMTYVAGTGMSRDFESLSMVKTKERNRAIKELRKSYAYGWRREEDGATRWVVDEVGRKEGESFRQNRRVDSF